jgi:hypothetical protein
MFFTIGLRYSCDRSALTTYPQCFPNLAARTTRDSYRSGKSTSDHGLSSSIVCTSTSSQGPQRESDHWRRVQRSVNNTFIYDSSGQCYAYVSPGQCLAWRGGAFDPFLSSTWTPLNLNSAYASEDPFINLRANIFGLDTLQLNQSASTLEFPFYIPRGGLDLRMNSLGLGRDSTILNTLFNNGMIASRSWSIFGGLEGAESSNQMEGQVVLGGYDGAKFKGENYTSKLDFDADCSSGVIATVVDMEIEDAGGPVSLLSEQLGSAVRFCIDPMYPLIAIPEAAGNIFRANGSTIMSEIGRSLGLNSFGMVYSVDTVYVCLK